MARTADDINDGFGNGDGTGMGGFGRDDMQGVDPGSRGMDGSEGGFLDGITSFLNSPLGKFATTVLGMAVPQVRGLMVGAKMGLSLMDMVSNGTLSLDQARSITDRTGGGLGDPIDIGGNVDNPFGGSTPKAADNPITGTSTPQPAGLSDGGNYAYDGSRSIWDDFVNRFYDSGAFQERYDMINGARGKQNKLIDDTISDNLGARDDANSLLTKLIDKTRNTESRANDYLLGEMGNLTDAEKRANQFLMGQINDITGATGRQDNLLTGLIDDMSAGNNLNPIGFSLGGNQISFIPRPNRETAGQIAGMGQQRYDNSFNSALGKSGLSQDIFGNSFDAANARAGMSQDIFNNSMGSINSQGNLGQTRLNNFMNIGNANANLGQMGFGNTAYTADQNPNMAFLNMLMDIADRENAMYATDKGIEQNYYKLAQGDRSLDQNEPGWLDYAKGIGTLGNLWNPAGGGGLGDLVGDVWDGISSIFG